MSSRILLARCRIVGYMPNLNTAVRHFAAFSSPDVQSASTHSVSVRPLPSLPEMLGNRLPVVPPAVNPSLLQIVDQQFEKPYGLKPTAIDLLECVAQDCSKSFCKDFQGLFPDRDLSADDLTVITLSQKTENDMTSWSDAVEEERESLLANFICGAKEICQSLRQAGFWADFIDPASGIPFLGSHTNDSLFETDERYKKLGFDIEDLGCCKVIRHHLWGTHVYVGSLFTNAPFDTPMIQQIMHKHN